MEHIDVNGLVQEVAHLKILVLGDVPPHVIGGAEMQTWRLALAWQSMGHRVEIAGHRIPNRIQDGIALISLPVFYQGGRALRAISYFLSLSGFLLRNQNRYDLIYCRFLGEAALSVAFLKQTGLIDLPLVAAPAAGGGEDKADLALLKSLPVTSALVQMLNRRCNCIVYIAPGIEAALSAIGIRPPKVAYIPNGVPIPSRTATGPTDKVSRLLFVGRLVYQKGIDLLLPALQRLQQRGLDFHLTLIGEGEMRRELQSQAKSLRLDERVTFLGNQPQSIVAEELAKAHLFVLPSRYEGLSNAALEAMAYGLPCLLSRCGGLDTLLTKETGWVFDPTDPNETELALVRALNLTPTRWRSMSRACRALALEHFSMESVAKRNVELFESLIHTHQARRGSTSNR